MCKSIDSKWLELANTYANMRSGCTKVKVGAVIIDEESDSLISIGANVSIPSICKSHGCLKVEKYGDNSSKHRNPEDCRSIHAEIDAIARSTTNLKGKTIYVTRYPCEGCARVIVTTGITTVLYSGEEAISYLTRNIFDCNQIDYTHLKD